MKYTHPKFSVMIGKKILKNAMQKLVEGKLDHKNKLKVVQHNPLLPNLLSRSVNCSTKEAWFVESNETRVKKQLLNNLCY